jgi:hypothetical protein
VQGSKLTKELGDYPRDSKANTKAALHLRDSQAGLYGSTLYDPRMPFKNEQGNKIREACEKLQVCPVHTGPLFTRNFRRDIIGPRIAAADVVCVRHIYIYIYI